MTTRIILPAKYVRQMLSALDLHYQKRKLADDIGIQLRLTNDGFEHININAYKSGTVLVQPLEGKKVKFIQKILRMRAARLRHKGEIE